MYHAIDAFDLRVLTLTCPKGIQPSAGKGQGHPAAGVRPMRLAAWGMDPFTCALALEWIIR
jgi:hypothetical protein